MVVRVSALEKNTFGVTGMQYTNINIVSDTNKNCKHPVIKTVVNKRACKQVSGRCLGGLMGVLKARVVSLGRKAGKKYNKKQIKTADKSRLFRLARFCKGTVLRHAVATKLCLCVVTSEASE